MRRIIAGLTVVSLAAAAVLLLRSYGFGLPTEARAKQRVLELAELVNYHFKEPRRIYTYLTREYRDSISESDFEEAFIKERSYPYLTPFFINFESIEMDANNMGGVATFSQAARLPGMVYKMPFVYENGNYYMIMKNYSGFPDGSYLDKFDKIPRYLTDGWDWD